MNLPFVELDKAARFVAVRAPVELRQDSYQEAWVRFMRYDPASFGGALLMGRHAVIDFLKREQRQAAAMLEIPEPDDADQLVGELRGRFPLEVEWLLAYYGTPNLTGAQRTQASRTRKRIKEALHEHV